MTTLTSTNAIAPASPGGLAGAASASGMEAQQDRFLKLLVAQMKNQDPLNPLDNAQVTTQMAQISTVSGIEKLNATLTALTSAYSASQSVAAAAMVGRSVLAPGTTLFLAKGSALFGMELAQGADQVTVTVRDAKGNTVHTMNLGPQPAGVSALHWDGTTDAGTLAADGSYSFSVAAVQGGKSVEVTPLALARVDAVTPGKNGVTLNLDGGAQVALTDVKQIF